MQPSRNMDSQSNGESLAKYPVVPSFQDWQFPHTEFQQRLWWPNTTTQPDLVRRCAVTQCTYSLDKAYLVPQNEKAWYHRNTMQRYSRDTVGDIDNQANLLDLRVDTHRCFDNKDWVIVPKPRHSDQAFASAYKYAVHILGADDPAAEFHASWHNSEVLNLQVNTTAYLFARFAWAVIQRVKQFVLGGVARNVVRVAVDEEGTPTWKTGLQSDKWLNEQYGAGGSKGATPRKKGSHDTSAADSEAEAEEEGEDESLTHTPFDPVELDIRLETIKRRQREE